jgi:hypothetical protein
MASVGIGFQLSANAAGMSQGINAGVVELQKLGLEAKKTAKARRWFNKTCKSSPVKYNAV